MHFDRQTRLGWLDPMHIQLAPGVEIEETTQEGRARVCFRADSELLSVRTTDKNALRYLKDKQVADGTVCEWQEGRLCLHIIELKRTVKENSWQTIKAQFVGALQNAQALCGVLGETEIHQVTLYTGYLNDHLAEAKSANPVLNKGLVGQRGGSRLADWHAEHLELMGHWLRHRKVPLDAEGNAEVRI